MFDQADYLMKLAAPHVEYGVHAEAELARIVAEPRPHPAVHEVTTAARWTRAPLALAAIVLTVIALSIGIWQPSPASATGPPMLDPKPISGTASELLQRYSQLRKVGQQRRHLLTVHSWATVTELDAKGATIAQNVEPSVTHVTFNPDGTQHHVITAGEPFPGQHHAGLRPPGTVLRDQLIYPKDTVSGDLAGPPAAVQQIPAWIRTSFGIDPYDPAPVFQHVSGYLMTSNPTPDQEAAILAHIARLPDLRVLGEVLDRNGRQAIGIATEVDSSTSEYEVLVVEPNHGSITGTETVRVFRGDLRVTYYAAWQRR